MKRILFFTTCFFVGMKLMAQSPVSFYPQENAQDINIDTHLVIEFDKAVKAGSKGVITVTDKTTRRTSPIAIPVRALRRVQPRKISASIRKPS